MKGDRIPTVSPIGEGRAIRSAADGQEGAQELGTLVVIGGAERKEGRTTILEEIVRRLGGGKLVVSAAASRYPDEMFDRYRVAFGALGHHDVVPLHVRDRKDASEEENVRVFDGASGIFFTGGDQLRITSLLGDTPVYERVRDLYRNGGVVAGTSAGASAMGDTMMVSGPSDKSHRLGDLLRMAQGLSLIDGLIIDQHFAERGRMGRLLGAIAQDPGGLAIGVDEDTAVVVENGDSMRVIGSGTVYVVDGEAMTHTNVREGVEDRALSAHDLTLHLLGEGDRYDMNDRRPIPVEEVERRHPEEVRQERRERRHRERRRGGGRRETDTGPVSARRAPDRRSGGRRREDD